MIKFNSGKDNRHFALVNYLKIYAWLQFWERGKKTILKPFFLQTFSLPPWNRNTHWLLSAAVAWSASVCSFSALEISDPFSASVSSWRFLSTSFVLWSSSLSCSLDSWSVCVGICLNWGDSGSWWLTGDCCRWCCCLCLSFSICLASWSYKNIAITQEFHYQNKTMSCIRTVYIIL